MRAPTERDYRSRILRVLVYIQGHLDDAISLDDLAAVAHFSPYHFHRVFRGMVGESVMGHIRRLRLERAAHRLKYRDQPVTRVAFEAGYETHEAFTRAFAAMFGGPPSQFRGRHRTRSVRLAPSGVHYSPDGLLEKFRPVLSQNPPSNARIDRLPPTRIAFVRHTGPYGQAGQAWERIFAWAGPRRLVGRGARILGVVHDDPEVTPPDKVRYDAGIVVDAAFRPEGEIGIQEVGGEYAVCEHRGPYETLGDTYIRLCGEWLPESGRELHSGPAVEVYRNSPREVERDDLLTDVYLPLVEQ
jgi:AraC family transcriptional regulator